MVSGQSDSDSVSDADINRMADALSQANNLNLDDIGRLVQRLGIAQRADRDAMIVDQTSFGQFLDQLGLNSLANSIRGLAAAVWRPLRDAIMGFFN